MFTARVACEPGGRKCAAARKSRLATPNLFHVHTPASTLRTRVSIIRTFRGAQTEPGAADALQEHVA
eukprot:6214115-Prymnesium_polylepis.1